MSRSSFSTNIPQSPIFQNIHSDHPGNRCCVCLLLPDGVDNSHCVLRPQTDHCVTQVEVEGPDLEAKGLDAGVLAGEVELLKVEEVPTGGVEPLEVEELLEHEVEELLEPCGLQRVPPVSHDRYPGYLPDFLVYIVILGKQVDSANFACSSKAGQAAGLRW